MFSAYLVIKNYEKECVFQQMSHIIIVQCVFQKIIPFWNFGYHANRNCECLKVVTVQNWPGTPLWYGCHSNQLRRYTLIFFIIVLKQTPYTTTVPSLIKILLLNSRRHITLRVNPGNLELRASFCLLLFMKTFWSTLCFLLQL